MSYSFFSSATNRRLAQQRRYSALQTASNASATASMTTITSAPFRTRCEESAATIPAARSTTTAPSMHPSEITLSSTGHAPLTRRIVGWSTCLLREGTLVKTSSRRETQDPRSIRGRCASTRLCFRSKLVTLTRLALKSQWLTGSRSTQRRLRHTPILAAENSS